MQKGLEKLSRYRILGKLGEGGMGAVYRAEDLELLRNVAIKVMPRQSSRSLGSDVRYLREARAASKLNHPSIVTIYEVGETDNLNYIVMEHVDGENLRVVISAGRLSPDQIVDIAIQVSDALAEAHSKGIIHRDIKPENIILTTRNQVKVLDFGLAKALGLPGRSGTAETLMNSLTETGAVIGTLSYMSPEQLRDEPLDERTDIFSFGILLYEMITGRLPFAGANAFEVAASILKDAAAEMHDAPPGLSRRLSSVIMRCLEKKKELRWASFGEIKLELQAIKSAVVSAARPAPAKSSREPSQTCDPRPDQTATARTPASDPRIKRLPAVPTVLILPLEAVGAEEESSAIGLGLAHAIMTDLARINGLSVLSKASSAGRRERSGGGANDLAKELGASILLEGEVIRSRETIGVMARLTDVETGRVIWGAQYRGDASDLFSIQDAVCESVASALKVNVSREVLDQIARPTTTNIDSFEFYSKGRAYLERREVSENIDRAIEMFQEAVRLDDSFALAHAGLCEAYWLKYEATHEDEWVERAIAAGDRALVLDPHQAQIHISLGIIYQGTGNTDRAIEEFEQALKLQPASADAYRWMGRCFTQKGDAVRAIGYLEKAIEFRPGYWDNYVQLGFCYYRSGRYKEALDQFRRVITIQPDNYLGYNNLGGIYSLLGRFEDAVAMHKRAIDIYPNHRSFSNLGTAYFHLGKYPEAISAYKSAIDLDPAGDLHYRNLGDAYLRVGSLEEARDQYARAIELQKKCLMVNPEDPQLLGRLAISQAKLGQKEEALANTARAATISPYDITLMYGRAVVYALNGDVDSAIEQLRNALSHGYSRSEAERDPDLETLRSSPDYRALFTPDRI